MRYIVNVGQLHPPPKAWAEVAINAANFPDSNFRKFLASKVNLNYTEGYVPIDKNLDGTLSDEEIEAVIEIDIDGSKYPIRKLDGIKTFKNLTSFKYSGSLIKEVDLSGLEHLQTFAVENGVTNITNIEKLNLSGTNVSHGDFSATNYPKLTELNLSNCHTLYSIRLVGYTYYGTLVRSLVKSLDVSGCDNLHDFTCKDGSLVNFNISNCPQLNTLNCNNNFLTELNLKEHTKLETLDCRNNLLTSLDLTDSEELNNLYCQGNNITVLDLAETSPMIDLSYSRDLSIQPVVYSYEDSFVCDFTQIIPSDKLVNIGEVKAYTEKGQSITSEFNSENGIFYMNEAPYLVKYEYNTGNEYEPVITLSFKIIDGTASFIAPTITTKYIPSGTEGSSYSALIEASARTTTPVIWSISKGSLPSGLLFQSSGGLNATITGQAKSSGTYNFTVKAENLGGSATQEYTLTINGSAASTAPSITTESLPNATMSSAYGLTFEASGTTPITWSAEEDDLPPGLSLSSEGYLNGTPIEAGIFEFEVKAYNVAGIATKTFTLTIENASVINPSVAPKITTTSLPDGYVDKDYAFTFEASGSVPITWSITNLPEDLSMNSEGYLKGTPTEAGTYSVVVTAKNSAGSDTKTFTIKIIDEADDEDEIAPTITTTSLTSGNMNSPYGYTLKATGTMPITWSAENLPDGITLSTNGYISGTPTESGRFSVKITATNSAGSDTKTLSLTIADAATNTKGQKPTFITTTADPVLIGEEYNFQLMASGTPAFTWSIKSGTLPEGLTLSSEGLISGTVTSSKKKSVTVNFTVTNDYGSATKSLKFTILALPEITTDEIKDAIINTTYSTTFKATGTTPLKWTLEGTLPAGLKFTNGRISGKPTEAGSTSLRIVVSNTAGMDSKQFTLKVNANVPVFSTASLKKGTCGTKYNATIKATGSKPITFDIEGALPEGLTFDSSTGKISGTPSEECTDREIIIIASNSGGDTSQAYRLTINPAIPKITTLKLPEGEIDSTYSADITATGSSFFTWKASGLPDGLTIDANDGTISGTPTEAGTFSVKITATNDKGSKSKTFKLVINGAPAFKATELPEATIGKSYNQKLQMSGSGKITYRVTDGKLPAGMSLNVNTGTIKGKPTEFGTFEFTITATNSLDSIEQDFTLTVNAIPPKFASGTLKNGTEGKIYSSKIKLSKGTLPIEWELDGDLPDGLEFEDGTISGTPEEAWGGYVTITATNSAGTDAKTLKLTIKASKKNTTTALPEVVEVIHENQNSLPENESILQKLVIVREQDRAIVKIPDNYEIAAVLPEVYVTESGMYDFEIELDEAIDVSKELIWLANSESPSDDDEIAEFYDVDGQEISSVPENHKAVVSAWLNKDIHYYPVIAVK